MNKRKNNETRPSGNKNSRVNRQPESVREPRPGYGDKKLDGPNLPST